MRALVIGLAVSLLGAAPALARRPEVGAAAPGFALESSTGKTIRLADYRGKRTVVLAFFPKAFTGGWTRELSAYRDQLAKFADKSAQVLGVSTDDVATQKKFADSLKLPFPLLADPKLEATRAYGVDGGGYAERVTFVIAADGRVVKIIEGKDALDPAPSLGSCPLLRKQPSDPQTL